MNDDTSLGSLIRHRRLELGLTQEELARRSSTHNEVVRQSDISRIESGQIQLPRRSRLENIASALDISLGEFLALSGWAGADQLPAQNALMPSAAGGLRWSMSLEQARKAWKDYLRDGAQAECLRPVRVESWKRCQDVGVDPRDIVFQVLPAREFTRLSATSAKLIDIARPHLERLDRTLSGKPHIVSLVNRDGWILDLLGTVEELGGREAGLTVGVNWSEKYIGNSGVGTCLVTGEPVLVYGIEFGSHPHRPTICFGVPILDDGKVIAAIGIELPQEHVDPERLSFAQICARVIEAELASRAEVQTSGEGHDPGQHPRPDGDAPLTGNGHLVNHV